MMSSLGYSVVLDWDEAENQFVATVPAFSVSTYGATWEEAMQMVREAIIVTVEGLCASGQPVPQGVHKTIVNGPAGVQGA